MPTQLSLFLDNVQTATKKCSEIKKAFRSAFEDSTAHKEAKEAYTQARAKLKQIEQAILSDYSGEIDKLEALKEELNTEKDNMTAEALQQFAKGESLTIKDKNGVEYEPIFSVKFKKIK
jgi:hypothetical protein